MPSTDRLIASRGAKVEKPHNEVVKNFLISALK
jgi:hypothetical protein